MASNVRRVSALKDTGVKREILSGVAADGLTQGEDYDLWRVLWKNGTEEGWLSSFPCMVVPGNTYTVTLSGKTGSSRYAEYNWSDAYTVSGLTEGYIKVTPVALSADAAVGDTSNHTS